NRPTAVSHAYLLVPRSFFVFCCWSSPRSCSSLFLRTFLRSPVLTHLDECPTECIFFCQSTTRFSSSDEGCEQFGELFGGCMLRAARRKSSGSPCMVKASLSVT